MLDDSCDVGDISHGERRSSLLVAHVKANMTVWYVVLALVPIKIIK